MERVKHYLSNCVAAPFELLARIALKAGGAILSRNRRIAERNLALGSTGSSPSTTIASIGMLPDGGVVGYPRYKGAEGVEAFCARLVEEHGVLLLPASIYRSDVAPTPDDHFRIGFGRRDFPAGLEALKAGLRQEFPATRRAG